MGEVPLNLPVNYKRRHCFSKTHSKMQTFHRIEMKIRRVYKKGLHKNVCQIRSWCIRHQYWNLTWMQFILVRIFIDCPTRMYAMIMSCYDSLSYTPTTIKINDCWGQWSTARTASTWNLKNRNRFCIDRNRWHFFVPLFVFSALWINQFFRILPILWRPIFVKIFQPRVGECLCSRLSYQRWGNYCHDWSSQ